MMRQIKFRAFVPLKSANNNFDPGMYSWRDIKEWVYLWEMVKEETIILMQYTGLNDTTKWEELTEKEREQWTLNGYFPSEWKGKEIYEGDICSFLSPMQRQDMSPATVNWSNGGYWSLSGIIKKLPLMLHRALSIKVIGNIYKNTELLEEIKDE